MVSQMLIRIGKRIRLQVGWLELTLALAAVGLFFQLFPSAWLSLVGRIPSLLAPLDARLWSRTQWIVGNTIVFLILVGVRYGPEMWQSLLERRFEAARERLVNARKKERLRRKSRPKRRPYRKIRRY